LRSVSYFVCLCILVAATASAQLAEHPPMGWNSWNHYQADISDALIRRVADQIVQNGMKDAGYIYINIDDGWQGKRDSDGRIRGNERFPDMKGLAEYVHARGLKIGIYSSPGAHSCGGYEGGKGHERQDAETFAQWGIDYLKYDVCTFRKDLEQEAHGDPEKSRLLLIEAYQRMGDALRATRRPIVYSLSEHGLGRVWEWAPRVGANLWRIGDDIHPKYESMTEIGFAQAGLAGFASPGHWNDPDMLEVGNRGMDPDECRTHMSLWALLAAPLIAGNDPGDTAPELLAVLTNREVIAIDQDPLGRQGDRVSSQGPFEIWSRSMSDGSIAVGLFNRNAGAAYITLNLAQLGLHGSIVARDLWRARDLGVIAENSSFLVPRHGVVLLRLRQ
jgi:alpha-galactosidase